jgi:apolipoprotein N-acyltransferase
MGAARQASDSEDGSYRNSVVWIEPQRGIVDAFDKTNAVPVVESAATSVLASLLGLGATSNFVEEGSIQRPLVGAAEFAPVLCYEALVPGLVAARRTTNTLAILNLSNDSWFRAEAASAQQLAFTSFRAIEQRLMLVRVAHGGISAAIDPYGGELWSLRFGTSGAIRVTVTPSAPPSTQERIALIALFSAAAAAGYVMSAALTRRILE